MPATYEPIATTTLVADAATISFGSIPATYTDLRVTIVYTSTGTISHRIGFNGETALNYSNTTLSGTGSSAVSSQQNDQNGIRWASVNVGVSPTIPQMANIDIFSYAGATRKTVLVEGAGDDNTTGYVDRKVGLWRNTAAINTINLYFLTAVEFKTGTTATLYGILKA